MADQEAVDNSALFKALDDDAGADAKAFKDLWALWGGGNKQRALIDAYYKGRTLISRSRLQECEEAVMQLKQLEQIVIRLAKPLESDSQKAAQIIIQTAGRHLSEYRQKFSEISGWVN